MHANLWIVVACACAVFGTIEAKKERNGELKYPFPQYGLCSDINVFSTFQPSDYEGIWFLQYKSTAHTKHLHTCQASYERKTDQLNSFFYVYEDGVPIQEPVRTDYDIVTNNMFSIHLDTEKAGQFNVFYQVLYADKESRITYMCTDHPLAKREKLALFIWSRDQTITEEKGKELINKLNQNGLNVEFRKVEQAPEKCAVYSAKNPLQTIAEKINL